MKAAVFLSIILTVMACRSKKVAQCDVELDNVEVTQRNLVVDMHELINDSCEVEIDSPQLEIVRPDSVVVVMKARKITSRKKAQTKIAVTSAEVITDSTSQSAHVVAKSVSERKPCVLRPWIIVAVVIGLIIFIVIIKKVIRYGKHV